MRAGVHQHMTNTRTHRPGSHCNALGAPLLPLLPLLPSDPALTRTSDAFADAWESAIASLSCCCRRARALGGYTAESTRQARQAEQERACERARGRQGTKRASDKAQRRAQGRAGGREGDREQHGSTESGPEGAQLEGWTLRLKIGRCTGTHDARRAAAVSATPPPHLVYQAPHPLAPPARSSQPVALIALLFFAEHAVGIERGGERGDLFQVG